MSRFIIFILVLSAVGCKSTKRQPPSETVILMMEKTACMGTCPVYKFEVYLDKTARYYGKEFVENEGEFMATLTDAQLDQLKNSFAEAEYFSFANVYSSQLTDLPTTFLYYHNGRESLKVTDYWGAPKELKELEKAIEDFIDSVKWQKVNPDS